MNSSSTKWYKEHPGTKAEADRKYRLKYARELKIRSRLWYEENKERLNAERRANYVPHPLPKLTEEEIKEHKKQNYLNSRDVRLAKASARYHSMTPEERIEHNRKRRERHAKQPQVRNRIERIRDHQKRAGGSLTQDVWQAVCKQYADTCIYCGSQENITIEHLTPVSKGGTNEATNLAPACLSCNSSKRNKTYDEYMEWRDAQNYSDFLSDVQTTP